MKIKKGDLVQVITGKDRGRQGEVLKALPIQEKIVVKGVNKVIKHKKNTGDRNNPGGRIEIEAPIHVSNAMLVSAKTGKPTRKRVKKTGSESEKSKQDRSSKSKEGKSTKKTQTKSVNKKVKKTKTKKETKK
ncbi:50S ribosomal protein L24 [Candidatus Dojkabacteria bacterium]|nr:50S ribosomal protein L24 [Candidatus Dojkabacteria bacterium]